MLLALFSGFSSSVWALDDDDTNSTKDFIKSRSYIGGFFDSMTINQNFPFDGTLSFTFPAAANETDLVPSINRQFGFGGLVGHREGAYAVELSYWRSDDHSATWTGGSPTVYTSTSSYQSINIDFKRYLFTELPAQPFFSLGVGFPWIVTENASAVAYSNGSTVFSQSTLSGIGINLGIGLEIYLGNDFSIMGGAIQRFNGFNQINGVTGQPGNALTLTGSTAQATNLEGDGLDFYVGGTVAFMD